MSRTRRRGLESVEVGTGGWRRMEVGRTEAQTRSSRHERKLAVSVDRRRGLVRIARRWDGDDGDYHHAMRQCAQVRCERGAAQWREERADAG